jgi:hypothetical protein
MQILLLTCIILHYLLIFDNGVIYRKLQQEMRVTGNFDPSSDRRLKGAQSVYFWAAQGIRGRGASG